MRKKICYRKSRRAQSRDDYETWVESDFANTLNLFDVGGVRTTTVIIEVHDEERPSDNT